MQRKSYGTTRQSETKSVLDYQKASRKSPTCWVIITIIITAIYMAL